MSAFNTAPNRGFARRLLTRFVTAMIFSTVAGQVLEMGYARDWPVVAQMKQEGADVGMALATWWNDLAFAREGKVGLPAGATHISILDIDEAACSRLASLPRCRFEAIGQPEVLDAAIAAADSARPKVIVLDLYLPTAAMAVSSPVAQRLLERLQAPGPAIVAPIEYRDPSGGGGARGAIAIDWANSICGQPRCGRLRYAPAFTVERFQSARGYPTIIRADMIPSSASPETAIRHDVPIESLALAAVDTKGGKAVSDVIPVLYTLPAFAKAAPQARAVNRARYFKSIDYDRLRLRQGMPIAPQSLASRVPGAILIIGSSAPIIDDLHDSPLGPMTGMEIVANAIRTLELRAGVLLDQEGIERRVSILTALGWAGVAATLAALGLVEHARSRRMGAQPRRLFDRWSMLTLVILLAGLALEVGFKLGEAIVRLQDPRARTADFDIIFPALAIFFTTGVEMSQRFLAKVEFALDGIFDQLGAVARSAASRLPARLGRPAPPP